MLSINDTVVYGTVGVCQVEGIEDMTIGRETKKYYVLKPIANGSSTVYIPLDSEKLIAKARKIISKPELDKLLQSDFADEWNENSTERAVMYTDIIKSGDRSRIIGIMLTLAKRRKALIGTGKKLRISDERAMRDCERIIGDEASYVLDTTPEKAIAYIKENVKGF